MAKKLKEINQFVTPIIRINGEKSPMENLFEGEEAPEIKSVGIAKIYKDRNHSWVSYTLTTKGREVINIEISEPDMKDIAEESAKVAFVDSFTDQGF